jgi:DNA-3-methyladenine glycosylase
LIEPGFFARPVQEVGPELLGATLLVDGVGGRIVELELYDHEDPASHGYRGRTPRNASMFGPPGHAYVYLVYGMHHCMNVVTEREGHGAAVLLRAVEPVRNVTSRTSGPGLLCRAMGIDRRLNAHDLLSNEFFVAAAPKSDRFTIARGPRIGVDYARHWAKRHLRFYIKDNPFVSPRA